MDGLEGHEVYTDNYYTSSLVYITLYGDNNNVCGTAQTNRTRFLKSMIRREREDRGYYIITSRMVLQHGMTGDLYIFCQNFMVGHHMGRQFDRLILMDHQVMFLVHHYSQQYMRGVDHSNQHIGYYNVGRSRKWWKRVFAHLIECALYNAYLLERYSNPSLYIPRQKQSYLSFRINVANQLIGPYRFRVRAGRQRSAESDETRLNSTLGHWPVMYCMHHDKGEAKPY